MAKKQNNDSFVDLTFPLSGIDLTTEFEEQRQGTTQEGVNVRAFEALTNRGRGGQRAGLGKYIGHTVGVLDADGADAPGVVVQHLAIIVDPTVEALLSDEPATGNTVNDPSTSNRTRRRIPSGQTRTVRRGGSGMQTNSKQPRISLTITADNQTKTQGDLFTFAGTEFTAVGLEALDALTTATIKSVGSPAAKANGQYPVTIKNVQGTVDASALALAVLATSSALATADANLALAQAGFDANPSAATLAALNLARQAATSAKQTYNNAVKAANAGSTLKKKYKIRYVPGVMTVETAESSDFYYFILLRAQSPYNPPETMTIIATAVINGSDLGSVTLTEADSPSFARIKSLTTGGFGRPIDFVPVAGDIDLGNAEIGALSLGTNTVSVRADLAIAGFDGWQTTVSVVRCVKVTLLQVTEVGSAALNDNSPGGAPPVTDILTDGPNNFTVT